MTTDDRLDRLLHRPPADDEPAPDARFTAAVMVRLPTAPDRAGSRLPWAAAAALLIVGAILPFDPLADITTVATAVPLEPSVLLEGAVAAALVVAALAVAGARRRMPS